MKTWHWAVLLVVGLILERFLAVVMPVATFIVPILIVYWGLTSSLQGRQLALMMAAAMIFDISSGLETGRGTLAIAAVIVTAILLRRRISIGRGSFFVIIFAGLFCILEFLFIVNPFFVFQFWTDRLWYILLEAGTVLFLISCIHLFLTQMLPYRDAS
ncbi:MAG: hypothetical protein A3A33_04530 [Candidatus Yanofskybacteria bacterium RIFCSPLOWO2_01_FULL_49_25]|uniref:Rod shape-determining protein MreD n=1 Tax=Candidatus Yanofskybacteria bacterium RIFCSPLOWO2_01_FULL_49_25 TaxID=1802701 RepID=A0A1F8GZ27_9BACT|nr:MAG: hypothetical protein A3A33_04530 [Candidatus Yanofskybacteria bacterium RIFCSPLOWO2_01_FULL_49_25]